MNRKDAEHAIGLYESIAQIDRHLNHIYSQSDNHRLDVKVGLWASVATGNYPIEMEVRASSPFAPAMRAAIEGQLLHEREIRAGGLRKISFDVPPAPTPKMATQDQGGAE